MNPYNLKETFEAYRIEFNSETGYYEVYDGDEYLTDFSDKKTAQEFINECLEDK